VVTWKVSAFRAPGVEVRPVLPASCRPHADPATRTEEGGGIVTRWTVNCGPAGLVGERIAIVGLEAAKIDGLVRATLADGRNFQTVLRGREPFTIIPERPQRVDVARAYAALGVEHILTGGDHLLFVFGLLMLVNGIGLLLKTITAFTVGHSVTLSLAVLGYARVPSAPIEVAIAASVLALAVELARDPAAPSVIRRFPWLMALAFGLLHGLGFAGALREVGLPSGEVPLALPRLHDRRADRALGAAPLGRPVSGLGLPGAGVRHGLPRGVLVHRSGARDLSVTCLPTLAHDMIPGRR
jgi:hypothetical protein